MTASSCVRWTTESHIGTRVRNGSTAGSGKQFLEDGSTRFCEPNFLRPFLKWKRNFFAREAGGVSLRDLSATEAGFRLPAAGQPARGSPHSSGSRRHIPQGY